MEGSKRKKLRIGAIFSLCVVPVIGLKYLLINRFGLLDRYHNANAVITYFVLFPLFFAGLYYSSGVLVDTYRKKRKWRAICTDFNVMMSMPTLLFFLYLMACLFGA